MPLSDDYDWSLWRTFLAVVRRGTLAAAAQDTGQTHPTVRRQIERLEHALDAPLFSRSQDGVRPTPLALRLLPDAEELEVAARQLVRAARREEVDACVRIAAGGLVAAELMPLVLAGVRSRHSRLRFELAVTDRPDAEVGRDAEVALTDYRPEREGIVASRVGIMPEGLFAHVDWVTANGRPAAVADMLARGVLVGDGRRQRLAEAVGSAAGPIGRPHYGFQVNDPAVALAAVCAGLGVGLLPVFVAERRALVRVAPTVGVDVELWACTHPDLRTASEVRAVLDALRAELPRITAPSAP